MEDPGFPRGGGANSPGGGANIRFCQIFPKTAWNWKNLDRGGASKILLCRSATALYILKTSISGSRRIYWHTFSHRTVFFKIQILSLMFTWPSKEADKQGPAAINNSTNKSANNYLCVRRNNSQFLMSWFSSTLTLNLQWLQTCDSSPVSHVTKPSL